MKTAAKIKTINKILNHLWDPINVIPWKMIDFNRLKTLDEYDFYVDLLYEFLEIGADANTIAELLGNIVAQYMEDSPDGPREMRAATCLTELYKKDLLW